MQLLIEKSNEAFESAPTNARVSPSIPILYFGDYDAFRCSELRIVTVGKNPSSEEFPSGNPFQRFPAATTNNQDAWNRYFAINPYKWFSTYDHLLAGFEASFYGRTKNTALHTDLLSPVATNPTWNYLDERDQAVLERFGIPLWRNLITFLKPHILLISVAQPYLEKIPFPFVQRWKTVLTVPRTKPYVFKHSIIKISGDFKADILFGQAAQTPFGTLGDSDKSNIGKKLKDKKILIHWQ